MHIFADGFSRVSLSNNNLRITLVQNTADKQQAETATLIIPASAATGFINNLAGSLKQLDEQIKAQAEAKEQKGEPQ